MRASVEENSEIAIGNLKERRKSDRTTEREVSIGKMSVPYRSVAWGWLSSPFLVNKPLPASFQPILKKKSLSCFGR